MELEISYIASDGEISRRKISDIRIIDQQHDNIIAFCHLRNENKYFKLINIQEAIIPETGEIIDNLWNYFCISKDENGTEIIESIVAPILPAIKALKYFCLQVRIKRGFSVKERNKIHKFIKSNVEIQDSRCDELDQWLKQIWVGNMYESPSPIYLENLKFIPDNLKNSCRIAAIDIASGSRKKPIDDEVLARINREFLLGEDQIENCSRR